MLIFQKLLFSLLERWNKRGSVLLYNCVETCYSITYYKTEMDSNLSEEERHSLNLC